MKWIAFGDSNTRYWLGAYSWPGPIEEAWPARLEGLCRAQGADLTVVNEGYPGEEIAFARAQFDGLTQGADRVILAFGTNNIKMPESTLEAYLSYLKRILEQNGQRPMLVLSILWFGEGYGFPGAQERLPGAVRAVRSALPGHHRAFPGAVPALQRQARSPPEQRRAGTAGPADISAAEGRKVDIKRAGLSERPALFSCSKNVPTQRPINSRVTAPPFSVVTGAGANQFSVRTPLRSTGVASLQRRSRS